MKHIQHTSPTKPSFGHTIGDNALATVKDVNTVIDRINEIDTTQSITAHPGGGQALAVPLILGFNIVTTATNGNSTILPSLTAYCQCNAGCGPVGSVVIKNLGAASLSVYPALGESIDILSVNSPITVLPGESITITSTSCTHWETFNNTGAVSPGSICTDATLTGDGSPGNCLHVVSQPASLAQFGYFFQTVGDVAGTIAANNGKALFQTASSNNTAGFTMVPASGDIHVTVAGIYEINWSLSAAEPGAMGVFINGALPAFAGTIYGSGAGTQQNTGNTLLVLAANDIISLRTVNCPAALTLQLAGTTNTAEVIASIMLKKIA